MTSRASRYAIGIALLALLLAGGRAGAFCLAPSIPLIPDHGVWGCLSVGAGGPSGTTRFDSAPEGETLADSQGDSGPEGQDAFAAYEGQLSTGSLGAVASGSKPALAQIGGAGGEASLTLKDTLVFTVPPGDYPVDVYATITGSVEGTVSSEGTFTFGSAFSGLRTTFLFNAGSSFEPEDEFHEYAFRSVGGVATEEGEADFTLRTLIAPAGIYGTPRNTAAVVGATLFVEASAVSSGVFDQATSASADFLDTASFLEIEVPPGVTWTSVSGVFLPEPAPVALLLVGAAVLGVASVARGRTGSGTRDGLRREVGDPEEGGPTRPQPHPRDTISYGAPRTWTTWWTQIGISVAQ